MTSHDMRARLSQHPTQPLSYPLRLPDDLQADTLRLLDESREVINRTVLWEGLDEFSTRAKRYAHPQVEGMLTPPHSHGNRQPLRYAMRMAMKAKRSNGKT
jgi:hypothetical protein